MIRLSKHSKEFEEEFYMKVDELIDDNLKKKIIISSEKYLPKTFFSTGNSDSVTEVEKFKVLILADFQKLKNAYEYIENCEKKEIYQNEVFNKESRTAKKRHRDLRSKYESLQQSKKNCKQMNIRIVRDLNINVCPYCNREYINDRSDVFSGAQLDHFYNKKDFPVFSLCLYNLVPICGNCNRAKSYKRIKISPYDDEFDFINSTKFSFVPQSINHVEVKIAAINGMETNIKEMKIDEAYEINNIDIEEIISKKEIFNQTQIKEIIENFPRLDFSENELKEMVFGNPIQEGDFAKKPLQKLRYDILKELDIYI